MFTKKTPNIHHLKEAVAKHLRAADSHAREKRFDSAMAEIQRALNLDPTNYYARSFRERVQLEITRAQKKESLKEKQAIDEDEKKLDTIAEHLRHADQFIAAKNYKAALGEVAHVYKIDPRNSFACSYSDRIEMLMSAEPGGTPQPVPPALSAPMPPTNLGTPVPEKTQLPQPPLSVVHVPPLPEVQTSPDSVGSPEKGSLVMYRQMLKEMWADGKITPDEDRELSKVRELFNISRREHEEAEKQVHIEAYVEALKIAWRDGVMSPTENTVLELMRQKYSITLEEHLSAEAKILWARNNNALTKGTILIVDDDRTLLLTLAAKLKKHGYEIVTADKIDRAIKLLDQISPHLILSDLMFGPGEMTGLEFYQHIRSSPKFKQLPFLLMSGISDEFVFRAGVRMGVDDFLAKPFSLELLLATIEGKLNA